MVASSRPYVALRIDTRFPEHAMLTTQCAAARHDLRRVTRRTSFLARQSIKRVECVCVCACLGASPPCIQVNTPRPQQRVKTTQMHTRSTWSYSVLSHSSSAFIASLSSLGWSTHLHRGERPSIVSTAHFRYQSHSRLLQVLLYASPCALGCLACWCPERLAPFASASDRMARSDPPFPENLNDPRERYTIAPKNVLKIDNGRMCFAVLDQTF